MSLESPDNEKNFPEDEAGGLGKKRDSSRKRDGKKEKKEKGYQVFEEEESEEEAILPDDVKSPTKVRKLKPGFKFPAKKDIFPRMKEKDKEDKKEKDMKKEDKDKKKDDKDGKKVKDKDKKKMKHGLMDLKPAPPTISTCENPIFGIPLAMAVRRNPSHDGIELPAIVRECIDYVEECGLTCEGIYRISGVKSKVQQLKEAYNKGVPVDLVEHEPNIVASLLKQFLRELPESVLTAALMPKFEEASTIKNERKKVEMFIRLIEDLPACNRLLLSWMIVHMTHIIELQKENKMTLQNVSIVLSPTMQISHRVLNALFTLAHQIFKDTYLKKYVPPLKPATSRWSLELPDNTGALEEELAKQESLLNQLHGRLNAGRGDPQAEEQLWEVQRVVTQLKRKIKFAKKSHAQGTGERRRKDLDVKRSSQLSDTDDLNLDLRPAPAPSPSSTPTTTTTTPATDSTTTSTAKTKTDAVEVHSEAKKKIDEAKGKSKNEGKKVSAPPAAKESGDDAEKGEDGTPKPVEIKGEPRETTKEPVENQKPPEAERSAVSAEKGDVKVESKSVKIILDETDKQSPATQKEPAEIGSTTPESDVDEASLLAEESLEKEAAEVEELESEETKSSPAKSELDDALTALKPVEPEPEHPEPEKAQPKPEPVQPEPESGQKTMELGTKEVGPVVSRDSKAEGEGEAGERKPEATLRVSLKGAGEVGEAGEVDEGKPMENVLKPAPVPVVEEKEAKPRGPVQVHPHLYLSLEPLQPIKAQPLKPRRERPEMSEESYRRAQKLRELEEELLGLGPNVDEEDSKGDTQADQADVGEDKDYEYDAADEEELQCLVEEEFLLRLEEEELLAIGDELKKKIETEESEIGRLQQEIQELQYLRHDSDMEEMSSNSDSSYESEDEEEMNDMLSSLIQENLQLERENGEMCQKIHEERMICLSVKLQIRLLQQKQLESSQSSLLGDF